MDAKLLEKTQELAKELAGQATSLDELNGVMRSLMKSALERMLDTELDVHLGRGRDVPATEAHAGPVVTTELAVGKSKNRKNGSSPKTVQGDLGQIPLDVPRDRHGSFEPQLLPKHQRRL